jgi:hypothetical protein
MLRIEVGGDICFRKPRPPRAVEPMMMITFKWYVLPPSSG